jgi:hypothetical protein
VLDKNERKMFWQSSSPDQRRFMMKTLSESQSSELMMTPTSSKQLDTKKEKENFSFRS